MNPVLRFVLLSALYWYIIFSLFVTYNIIKALYFKFYCSVSDYYEHYYPDDNNYDNTENV